MTFLLAAITLVALVCELLMAAGVHGTIDLGLVRIGLNDFVKPLAWGASAAGFLWLIGRASVAWRRTAAGALVLLAALGAVNFATYSPPIVTDSDLALGELAVELATRGEQLLGAYSRFGWHHPGPLFSYLVAPIYLWSGHQAAAMYATALAVNLGALVAMAWVIRKETSNPLAAAIVAVCLFFAWRAPRFLASPWNAHVGVLPSLAFLVTAAAVAAGRVRLLPLMAVFGSFAVQAHVGFAPLVLVVSAVVGIRMTTRGAAAPRPWAAINAAAWIALVLWTLPLAEAAANRGGNLAALWRFFVGESAPGHSIREAAITACYALAGPLRPDFDLPWGGHFELAFLWWAVPGTLAMIAGLAIVARTSLTAGRAFEGWLATLAIAATLIGAWGLTRIRGDILNHDLFRISAIGALNLGILIAAGLRGLAGRLLPSSSTPNVAAASTAVLAVGAIALGVQHLDSLTSFERRQPRAQIVEAHKSVRAYLDQEHVVRPLIRIGNDRWSDAAGVILRLVQEHAPLAVMDDHVSMFGARFAATGDEDARVTLADLELHRELREQPDNRILLTAFPLFVDATRLTPVSPGR